MKSLIYSEWYKLRRDKSFRIILASVATIIFIQAVSDYFVSEDSILGQHSISDMGHNSTLLALFIAAFVGFFVASEFQNGTLRNTLALGKSRVHVYLSKVFSVSVAVVAIVTIAGVVATISYSVTSGFGDMTLGEYLRYLTWTYPAILFFFLPYGAVCVMFACISKSPITTALLGVGYVIVVLSTAGFFNAYPGGGLAFLVDFYPEKYMYLSKIGDIDPLAFVTKGVLVSSAYIALFSVIGSTVFKKSDIK